MDSVDQESRANEVAETMRDVANLLTKGTSAGTPHNNNPGEETEQVLGSEQLPDGGDVSDPNAYPTVDDLVVKLLDPPNSSYFTSDNTGMQMVRVKMTWIKGKIGEAHFEYSKEQGRSVLRQTSKIRTHGVAAGLPKGYYNFLCGGKPIEPGRPDIQVFWMQKEVFRLVPVHLRGQQ